VIRKPVKSSQIKSVGYEPSSKMLEVEFANGAVYRYHGVEDHDHHAFVNAPSIGSHFHAQIKGKHKHEKVTAK